MGKDKIDNKVLQTVEKSMVALGMGVVIISLLLGYWVYALGVALASSIAWLLYRWQMMAVDNTSGLSPQKATNRMVARSMIKLVILLSMIGLSSLGGNLFLFGVLTGLLLQVIAYFSRAILIYKST